MAVLNPDPGTGATPDPPAPGAFSHTPFSFRTNRFTYTKSTVNYLPDILGISVTLNQLELDRTAGGTVDRVSGLPGQNIAMSGLVALPGGQVKLGQPVRGQSCADPRLNWNATYWYSASPTPGTTNVMPATAIGEGISEMYVRNGPVKSVAELGYLNVGAPWRTIALYNAPGTNLNPVLARFRIGDEPTNSFHGLVNLNSRRTNALACVFNDCPIESGPGFAVGSVSWAQAQQLASFLVETNWIGFTNVAGLGLVDEMYTNVVLALLTTDARKESLIRNSCQLLSPRQNLFTLILAAQALDSLTNVVAEQRAVAMVWRDPAENADGHHPAFVRFFKWLNE
jgi:hypothetical protein